MGKIIFELNRETVIPQNLIDDAPSSGPFDHYADYICENFEVISDPAEVATYLRNFGAWSELELLDAENIQTNVKRLLWISILDCKENKTAYFYMGN